MEFKDLVQAQQLCQITGEPRSVVYDDVLKGKGLLLRQPDQILQTLAVLSRCARDGFVEEDEMIRYFGVDTDRCLTALAELILNGGVALEFA